MMCWRPVVDLIEVHAMPEGKRLRLCLEGVDREIDLDAAAAAHLAGLLTS